MHQSTTPSLSQTIWPRWASTQSLTVPIVQTLLPVILVIPYAQRRLPLWDNWGDERGCDEGHWHAHTGGHPWGLLEVVGMVQQPEEITSKGTKVSCVYYQWKSPYEKSLETYLMILVFPILFPYSISFANVFMFENIQIWKANQSSWFLLPSLHLRGVVVPAFYDPICGSNRTVKSFSKDYSVIYWPSTETSIKGCTCVNKRKNSGSRCTLNNNITRAQTVWVSWRQDAEA